MKRLWMMMAFFAMTGLLVSGLAFADSQTSKQNMDKQQKMDNQPGKQQRVNKQEAMDRLKAHATATQQRMNTQASLRGSDLIGMEVDNRNQEELGTIQDIVISPNGRVNYVILSHGGILGIGDRLIPIPFSAVETGAGDGKKIVLDVAKKDLENAPSFASNEWPDFQDRNFAKEVHGYYGTREGSESDMRDSMNRSKDARDWKPGQETRQRPTEKKRQNE